MTHPANTAPEAERELASCPFCGGEAQTDFIEGESYLIECYGCRAETGIRDSAEEAITAWNRRAQSPVDAAPADSALLDDALSTVLWLQRRMPRGYGLLPFVQRTIEALAVRTGVDVSEFLDAPPARLPQVEAS